MILTEVKFLYFEEDTLNFFKGNINEIKAVLYEL